MLQKCFYLVAILTTVISMTFSNVTFYPTATNLPLGSLNLKVRNLVPESVDWPSMNVSSTSDALAFSFDDPIVAKLSVQVYTLFFWLPASMQVSVTGGASFKKPAADSCDSEGFTRDFCNAQARVGIRGFTGKVIADVPIDVCDMVESMAKEYLTAPAQQSYPALAPKATDIAKLLYFRKFVLASSLTQSVGIPMSKTFVAKNAMRVTTGSLLPFLFEFDTADNRTSQSIDAVVAVSNMVKKLMNITTSTNATDSTTSVNFQGGTVTVPTLENLVQQVISKEARAALKAYVPAGAALVYDIVVNDLQCKFFNTICTIPAENGIQVINAHFTGFGDLNGILDNAMGSTIDAALTNFTFETVKKTSLLSRGRYYLPLI